MASALERGEIDTAAVSYAFTEARYRKYAYSLPVTSSLHSIYYSRDLLSTSHRSLSLVLLPFLGRFTPSLWTLILFAGTLLLLLHRMLNVSARPPAQCKTTSFE